MYDQVNGVSDIPTLHPVRLFLHYMALFFGYIHPCQRRNTLWLYFTDFDKWMDQRKCFAPLMSSGFSTSTGFPEGQQTAANYMLTMVS